MPTFKEELKKPIDWKSIILILIAIIGFTKGCGNEFIANNQDVRANTEFREDMQETIKEQKELNKELKHQITELQLQVKALEVLSGKSL